MTEQIQKVSPKIDASWYNLLKDEFQKDYFQSITSRLKSEKAEGKTIYPPGPKIFAAFNECPADRVKVVIIGQDPYHGPDQANGLCFSVHKGIKSPPSLVNIFKELNNDTGAPIPDHGDLSGWARQGVLLLNAMLTVRAGEPGSHSDIGWETFTNQVIRLLSKNKSGLVFLLWGKFARQKAEWIDKSRHFILEAAHPSPYSANNGFFGSNHFSVANELLKSSGQKPVDWDLTKNIK